MTIKLYDKDSHLAEFVAMITAIKESADTIEITTDKTAFFPEGGGQSCDKGTLEGMRVCHVRLDGDKIIHVIERKDFTVQLPVGMSINGKIDMAKRFSDMQQHSGEHIVSGIVHRKYGCDNVGFHLGEDYVTLDFNYQLSAQQLEEIELLANKAVCDNLPITISYPAADELSTLPYRSKKELDGAVRIVEIKGIDLCACCAPHVKNTGEIGLIYFVAHENYKSGTRLYILCGNRAIMDIRLKANQNHAVAAMLSAKEYETAAAVERLSNEKNSLSKTVSSLERRLIYEKAKSIEASERIIIFEQTDDASTLRELAVMLKEKAGHFAAVLGCDGECVKKYVVCGTRCDARNIGKALNESFFGRGGGKADMVQGTVSAEKESVKSLLETFDA